MKIFCYMYVCACVHIYMYSFQVGHDLEVETASFHHKVAMAPTDCMTEEEAW